MKKNLVIIVLVMMVFAMTALACAQEKPVANTDVSVTPVTCVYPESDNDKGWSSKSCVDINTQVYSITVKVMDEMVNHTETNASGSAFAYGGGYASASWRMWQDGKGILPVVIMEISPEFHGILAGDYILLKTSDLKAMALPNGSTTKFICNQDVEVLSPVENLQVLTSDRLTYELDNCRMTSPKFVPQQ